MTNPTEMTAQEKIEVIIETIRPHADGADEAELRRMAERLYEMFTGKKVGA